MSGFRSWVQDQYSSEGFRGPVITVLSGTTVSLLVAYLALPVLTRLFTPAEFGVSDYFVMVISVLVTFASLRYEDAIMLPESDRVAGTVVVLSAILVVVTAAVVFFGSFFGGVVAPLLGAESVMPWLWLLAPTLVLMRLAKLGEIWSTRQKRFRQTAGGEIINKSVTASSRIGAGAGTNLGAGGLIGGFAAGQLVTAVYYAAVLRKRVLSLLRSPVSLDDLRASAKRYRRFPIYATPAAILNVVVSRLPVLLLPLYFTMETVGLFGRAFVALAVPLSLVGGAVSQVFFVHAVEAHREKRLNALTEMVHDRLVMFAMFPAVLLIFLAPELFAFVFGPAWQTAGVYEQYLALWFFTAGVASPLTRLFDVLEKQRIELVMSVITCVALIAAFVVGGRTGDAIVVMAAIGAAGTAVRGVHIAVMMKLAGVRLRAVPRPYVRYLLISLPLVLVVFLTKTLIPLWLVAVASAFMGACYLAIVLRGDRFSSIASERMKR